MSSKTIELLTKNVIVLLLSLSLSLVLSPRRTVGSYTCVGLSLVEIFSHENPDDNDLLDTSAGGAGDRDALENSQKTGKSSVPLLEVPVPKLGRSYSEAGSVALREVWQASGATCATAFKEEARTQYSLQLKSVSLEAAAEQR